MQLVRGLNPSELMITPLWGEMPGWFIDSWRLARKDIGNLQPEGTFATWLDRRIMGEVDGYPFREGGEAEFLDRLIESSNKWWAKGPTTVDADIAEWLRELAPEGEDGVDDLRKTLRETASPDIFVVEGQLDARANPAFEQPGCPGLDQLEHLLSSARLLQGSFQDNAPPRLTGALREYGDTIERNRQRPVLQTLILCAAIIGETRQHEDFGFWGENLGTATDLFLEAHRKWVENHPGQKDLSEGRAGLKIRDDASIQQAVADFIGSARGILEQLKTADLTRDRAYDHLKAQLDLGLDLIYGSPDEVAKVDFSGLPQGWTPLQTYAANESGVWLKVLECLSTSASLTAHPLALTLAGQVGAALGPLIGQLFG